MSTYNLTTEVWEIDPEEFPSGSPIEEQARFLLRYAILAPSSHNSQPWEFSVDSESIEVYAAEDRWLEVADYDKRELYISLGCAVENLCIAAEHFDIGYQVEYQADSPVSIVKLQPGNEQSSSSGRPPELFDEIRNRYTNHQLFEDKPLPEYFQEQLADCVIEDEVALNLIDNPNRKGSIAELQGEADRLQMEEPEYRKELGYWVGTGALGDSWLKARVGQAVVTHLNIGDREAQKNSKLVRSAPVVGVLVAEDDPVARIKTGQVFERLALAATSEGIAVHPMSQILERPEMREELSVILDDGNAPPQHLFRIGYVDEEQKHTPRWPLENFLLGERR